MSQIRMQFTSRLAALHQNTTLSNGESGFQTVTCSANSPHMNEHEALKLEIDAKEADRKFHVLVLTFFHKDASGLLPHRE